MKIAVAAVLLLVLALFLPMPPDAAALRGLDPAKVRLGLALFTCIAFLWMTEALPLAVTALLVPVLAAAMGLVGIKDSLVSFSAPPIFLFFGGFALASALSAQGLDVWLAEKLGRLGKGRFIRVSILLFITTALLSMWMSNTATTAMMIPLALGVLARFKGIGENPGNAQFLILGLAYSASIGGLGTIVGSPPNGIAAKALGISFSQWMKFGIPAVLVLLPAMIGALYLMLRPTDAKIAVSDACEVVFTFTTQRKFTLIIFAITALAWIFSQRIAAMTGISEMDTWIALSAVLLLSSSRVVSWDGICRGTDWGVLLLFGGGLALSAILGTSGASLFMARLLGGMVVGWPLWAVIAAVVTFVIFLTEVSSNTASAALLVPIFVSMAGEFGLPAAKLILPLGIAASCAFMLPVGTPPNAIAYATGHIPQRVMIRVGFALNILFVLLITAMSLLLF